MLGWAITFVLIALVAAFFGFGGAAAASMTIAHWLFIAFIVLLLVAGLSRALRGRTP